MQTPGLPIVNSPTAGTWIGPSKAIVLVFLDSNLFIIDALLAGAPPLHGSVDLLAV
jgi:hypothetical protein